MPAYIKLDAATVEPTPGAHPAASPYDKGIGQALGVGAFGLYQVELPPGCETVAHDHASDGVEDVYAVIGGAGSAVIDGEEVALVPGEFIAVPPESVRYVRAGAHGLVFIAVCASARS
jgi:quercetin dioxygenase-like cupin family protein